MYRMYVNLHETQTEGIGAPISRRFNSGSLCLVGSQPPAPFHSTQLLQLMPHPVQVFHSAKHPRRHLDLAGLFPKLDLKLRGIQQCLVWLVSVQDTRSLPALNVSCKDKE